jgi:hypothetical protein
MKRVALITATMTIVVLALASLAPAEVPQMINYQGRLTDSTGAPVPDSNYQITFTIYCGLPPLTAWTSGPQTVSTGWPLQTCLEGFHIT